jgi:hypothetical protein
VAYQPKKAGTKTILVLKLSTTVEGFNIFHFCGSKDRALSGCFLSLGQVSVELGLF